MTKWQEFPLRPHGSPWPGLHQSSSKIMTIGGEMSECTNVIINEDDVLQKRKGLVRAFDERFNGVVCGLFRYTDEYGRERILIADELGFAVRTPYVVPVFEIADCYPFDNFDGNDGDPLDEDNWRNRSRYQQSSDEMRLDPTAAAGNNYQDVPTQAVRWFKDACSRNYQVRIQYNFGTTGAGRVFSVIIRGNQDTDGNFSGALLLATLIETGITTREVRLYWRDASDTWSLLDKENVLGDDGFFTFEYNQTTRIGKVTINPTGESIVTRSTLPFSEIQDADFGLGSAINLAYTGATVPDMGILVVDGGTI